MTHFIVWSKDDPQHVSSVYDSQAQALAYAEAKAAHNPGKSYFVAQLLTMSTSRGVDTIELPGNGQEVTNIDESSTKASSTSYATPIDEIVALLRQIRDLPQRQDNMLPGTLPAKSGYSRGLTQAVQGNAYTNPEQ